MKKSKVGCAPKRDKPKVPYLLHHNDIIRLYSPRSTNNYCLDACGYHTAKHRDKKFTMAPANVRQKLKIPLKTKLDPASNEAHKIFDFYNVSYRCWWGLSNPNREKGDSIDKTFKLYHKYGEMNNETIDIIIMYEHAYLIKDKNIYSTLCDKCGHYKKTGLDKHECKNHRVSYHQTVIKDRDILRTVKLKLDTEENWVFFDLESFPCGKGQTHCVYAVGWYDYQPKQYDVSYGKNSIETFMKYVLKNDNKTYIAYNGCKFDFYFLQKELLKAGITPEFLLSNGRILSMKWGDNNQVWDLYNFMIGFSLKNACKAFDTEIQKQNFDHEKMKTWKDVSKYKEIILDYLKHDVMSLVELTEKYVHGAEQLFSASPTKYLTLSNYNECAWKAIIPNGLIIEVPPMDKQNFIGLSVFGGRTYPSQKTFKSKFCDKINELWEPIQNELDEAEFKYKDVLDDDELKDICNKIKRKHSNAPKLKEMYWELKKSTDYIYNGDINSQYPACMAGVDLIDVRYPTGYSEWITDSKKCATIFKKDKQLGIYTIKFICPKNLKHAILPRKKKGGGVEWSLTDGQGVYNTIDIQHAIKFGYKIEFLDKALVWETVSDTIFTEHINKLYEQKVKAKKEGNTVKYNISKSSANSLFGKCLQRPICSEEKICKNVVQCEKFLQTHILTDWEVVDKSDSEIDYIILSGERTSEKKISKKPRQLGSFILGYSRRLWLLFLEAIDPTNTKHITTYQDTDSLHISGKYYDILVNKGLIDDKKLGYLSNDCDNDGLIYREINLAPKCYNYLALTKDGAVLDTMKSKGIKKTKLEKEWFDAGVNRDSEKWKQIVEKKDNLVNWSGMKKINKRLTKAEREAGVEHWSVIKKSYDRTFYANEWKGMDLSNNIWYPFGYES